MTGASSQLAGYARLPEPELVFHHRKKARHPLVGLIDHGPYSLRFGAPARLRIALVARASDLNRLRNLVGELGRSAKPREALNYYPEYPGFEALFRVPIAPLNDRTTVQLPPSLDDHAAAGDKVRLATELFQAVAMLARKIHSEVATAVRTGRQRLAMLARKIHSEVARVELIGRHHAAMLARKIHSEVAGVA